MVRVIPIFPPGSRLARAARILLGLLPLVLTGGCLEVQPVGQVQQVWGGHGTDRGQFHKPRAIAINDREQLYVVDMTGRVQVFSPDGEFQRSFRTPEIANGKPSGLSFDRQGRLMVADTHYFRVLFYTPEGERLAAETIGGENGNGPGQFNFVTDAVQDADGNYYVGEYGSFDRIQKFDAAGKFVCEFGGHGDAPGQFVRPQNLAIDAQQRLWVADACNHRIQVFDTRVEPPQLLRVWGEEGEGEGQLRYPYDLVLDGDGHVYVCEFGNHRIQKFTEDGRSLGTWGSPGREPGQLYQPWAIARDRRGRLYVVDTYNHRIQRFTF